MSFDLSNYTTVNERILQFHDRYPNGVISTHPAKIVELAQHAFISVIAEVYMTPDAPPVLAEAWETFPGKTPYTRDSEMMNAATSAIGRALMQLGIGIDKSGASREEVQARTPLDVIEDKARAPKPPKTEWDRPDRVNSLGGIKATEKQLKLVHARLHAIGVHEHHHKLDTLTKFLNREVLVFEDLRKADIDAIAKATEDELKKANFATMGLELITNEAPAEDDPWAVEKW